MMSKLKFFGKFMLASSFLATIVIVVDLGLLYNFQYLYADLATDLRLFPDERVFEYVFTQSGFFISGFITLVGIFTILCVSIYLVMVRVFPKSVLKMKEYFLNVKSLMSVNMQRGIVLGSILTGGIYLGVFIVAICGYQHHIYAPFERPNILLENIYLTPLTVLFLNAVEKSKLLLIISTILHWPVVCAVGALLLDKVQKVKPHNRKN